MQKLHPAAIFFASAMLAPAAVAQQATWTEVLGFGGAIDLSLDGTYAALIQNAVWDATNGAVPIAGSDAIDGIDATGTLLAGDVTDGLGFSNAGYYDGVSWTPLGAVSGNCDANKSSGYDISDDGSTVVGLAWEGCTARAFYWTQAAGLNALPGAGTSSARANCVDITGTIVGGWDRVNGSSDTPAIWTDFSQPPTLLGSNGEVNGISADGQTFCGEESFTAAIFRTGQPIEYVPNCNVLTAMDAAGETFVGIGGTSGPFGSPEGIFYRADTGSINIETLATNLGITSPNLSLAGFAFSISADGNTIGGGLLSPFLPFASDAFILTIPDIMLWRDVADISVGTGGTQTLDVKAGPSFANDIYFVLGSASGTAPGFAIDGINIPLNIDSYFNFTLTNPNTLIAGSFGTLDGNGSAQASLTLGAGSDPALAGASVDHAAVVIDSGTFLVSSASNTQSLTLVP